ncbi:MAG: helix-turn-helix domain-containing protein [Eubacteriales bacterium]
MELGLDMNVTPSYRCSAWKVFQEGERHVRRVCTDDVLLLMTEGTLRFTEDGRPVRLTAGEYYIQQRGLRQEGDAPSSGARYYYIHFCGSCRTGADTLPLRGKMNEETAPLIRQLETCRLAGGTATELAAPFCAILALLRRTGEGSARKRIVSEAACAVSRDLRVRYSLGDLARLSGYSKNQLTNIFRAETGQTPCAYMQRIRLDAARQLLENSDLPVGRIAEETGFGSYVNFYKAFCAAAGCSPAAWRKSVRGMTPGAP